LSLTSSTADALANAPSLDLIDLCWTSLTRFSILCWTLWYLLSISSNILAVWKFSFVHALVLYGSVGNLSSSSSSTVDIIRLTMAGYVLGKIFPYTRLSNNSNNFSIVIQKKYYVV